ncbi:MAG: CHAT domain-containing protein [Bryobacteraceae bacterium]
MASHFDLIITADSPRLTAELRLLDAHGVQLAYRPTDFKTIAVSRRQGLFDLRNYLRHYVELGREAASIAEVGVSIADEVLGAEIFRKLWESESQRVLRIRLPGAGEVENHLAAALARVPWEIARPAANQPTLGERNLLVRVVHEMAEPATQALDLGRDNCLRVLFVFAEARGSRPLAARRERQELLRLFEKEIYPQRRVVADFLTHGVTRERLEAQIADRAGYHIVHWSGHGHMNLLELSKPGGAKDHLSGQELLDLFTDAGGFIPRLFFLSACHSGDILRVKDWNEFLAVAEGKEPGTKHTPAPETREIPLEEQPGYTGTAHALLQGGVPSVVAMRYAVGDEYARDLGVEFYRALLAHTQPKNAAAALTMARRTLLDAKEDSSRYALCDHATPVLYGAMEPGLTLPNGRSPALEIRHRRLHRIAELTLAEHRHFVGRTWELAGLGADFIGSRAGAEVKPVAVITGLGGMGKTALAAEVLALWESRFVWVLLYQAKPNALGFDATLRDIDLKLREELGRYHKHVRSRPADAIYRAADAGFTGAARLERLTHNLVRALQDEPILLVLDNFENNLKEHPQPGSSDAAEALWACQDAAWDRCLRLVAKELAGSPSRVLITCRRPLSALAGSPSHAVQLGPLPAGEAALYLREHAGLRQMVFGGDTAERALAMRLLNASRFHPLLMDRLARLATGGAALRPQLLQALERLETSHDFSQLPALFAASPGDAKELAYLNDALAVSLDQLIQDASPDARRLLWVIAVANEPVTLGLLRDVWTGEEDEERRQLRQIKQLLDNLHALPSELQEKLKAMPPEARAILDALPPAPPARPDPVPLLHYLVAVGLATEERTGPDDANPDLTCHELVRERIRAWMRDHPPDRADLTENSIRLAYAGRLEAVFKALRHQNMTAALQAGSRALVYCAQAEAYDRLGDFASGVVTGARDPRLLERLRPHLEAAAASAPEGRPRWSCLCNLADALMMAGRSDAGLPFYEQAGTQAHAAAEAGGEAGRQAWADVAVITGNWANALRAVGKLDGSRQRQLESAEASKKAGRPAVYGIGSELEALRIDIIQGRAAQALPQVEARLQQVEAWWQRHRSGQTVPEAPDPEFLARVFITALDIATDAHFAQKDWEPALHRIDAILEVKQALQRPAEDLAATRGNRANVLGRLRRFGEAKAELEACLQVFENDPANRGKVLSSLADVFDKQGDGAQAIIQERRALAIREQLPDPSDRAISHNNLAIYLDRGGISSVLPESRRHRLAALVYFLVSGLGQDLQTSLGNYAIRFRRARAAGVALAVPRLAELLADPAFRPLDDWLRQRQVNPAELQAAIDQLLEQVRQSAL